jgi:hypothetical protein
MTKRKIQVSFHDMRVLLEHGANGSKVMTKDFTDEVQVAVDGLERGSMCFVLENPKMAIVAWRATQNVGVVVNKKECHYMLEKLLAARK